MLKLNSLTVGGLRRLIAAMPDDTVIRPAWVPGEEPGDHEPGVQLLGFDAAGGELVARVALFYLDEIQDEEVE